MGLRTTRTTGAGDASARGPLPAVSGLAALLAVAGHAAGGGALPTSCALLVAALLAALITTWAAVHAGVRRLGSSTTLGALAVGQIAIEALLSAPADRLPPAPLAAAAVHAVATIALGTVLLGSDRVVDDLLTAFDRVLPRWWRLLVGAVATWPQPRLPRPVPLAPAPIDRDPRSLRGPPASA